MVHGTPKYNPFEMGGPRWNKVGTGYVQSVLTTKTPFTVQNMSKLGPQEVPKEVQMVQNSTYGAVMVQGAPKWLEQGWNGVWQISQSPIYRPINVQIGSKGGPKLGSNGPK